MMISVFCLGIHYELVVHSINMVLNDAFSFGLTLNPIVTVHLVFHYPGLLTRFFRGVTAMWRS